MTDPIDRMVEAYNTARAAFEWDDGIDIKQYNRIRDKAAMRAAVLALAEMRPSKQMEEASYTPTRGQCCDLAKAYIRAAAKE